MRYFDQVLSEALNQIDPDNPEEVEGTPEPTQKLSNHLWAKKKDARLVRAILSREADMLYGLRRE